MNETLSWKRGASFLLVYSLIFSWVFEDYLSRITVGEMIDVWYTSG